MLLPQVLVAACALLATSPCGGAEDGAQASGRPPLSVADDIASSWSDMVDRYRAKAQGRRGDGDLFPADLVLVMRHHSEGDVLNALRRTEPGEDKRPEEANGKDVLMFLEKELELIEPEIVRDQEDALESSPQGGGQAILLLAEERDAASSTTTTPRPAPTPDSMAGLEAAIALLESELETAAARTTPAPPRQQDIEQLYAFLQSLGIDADGGLGLPPRAKRNARDVRLLEPPQLNPVIAAAQEDAGGVPLAADDMPSGELNVSGIPNSEEARTVLDSIASGRMQVDTSQTDEARSPSNSGQAVDSSAAARWQVPQFFGPPSAAVPGMQYDALQQWQANSAPSTPVDDADRYRSVQDLDWNAQQFAGPLAASSSPSAAGYAPQEQAGGTDSIAQDPQRGAFENEPAADKAPGDSYILEQRDSPINEAAGTGWSVNYQPPLTDEKAPAVDEAPDESSMLEQPLNNPVDPEFVATWAADFPPQDADDAIQDTSRGKSAQGYAPQASVEPAVHQGDSVLAPSEQEFHHAPHTADETAKTMPIREDDMPRTTAPGWATGNVPTPPKQIENVNEQDAATGAVRAKPLRIKGSTSTTTPGWVIENPANPTVEVVHMVPVHASNPEGEPAPAKKLEENEVSGHASSGIEKSNVERKTSKEPITMKNDSSTIQPASESKEKSYFQHEINKSKSENNLKPESEKKDNDHPVHSKKYSSLDHQVKKEENYKNDFALDNTNFLKNHHQRSKEEIISLVDSNNKPVPILAPLQEERLKAMEEAPINIKLPAPFGALPEIRKLFDMHVNFDHNNSKDIELGVQQPSLRDTIKFDPASIQQEAGKGEKVKELSHLSAVSTSGADKKGLLADVKSHDVKKAGASGGETARTVSRAGTLQVHDGQPHPIADSHHQDLTSRLSVVRSAPENSNGQKCEEPPAAENYETRQSTDSHSSESTPSSRNKGSEVSGHGHPAPSTSTPQCHTDQQQDSLNVDDSTLSDPDYGKSSVKANQNVIKENPSLSEDTYHEHRGNNDQVINVSKGSRFCEINHETPIATPVDQVDQETTTEQVKKKKKKKKKGFKLPFFVTTTTKAPWPKSLANLAPFLPIPDLPWSEDTQIRPPLFRHRPPNVHGLHHPSYHAPSWSQDHESRQHDVNHDVNNGHSFGQGHEHTYNHHHHPSYNEEVATLPPLPYIQPLQQRYQVGPPSFDFSNGYMPPVADYMSSYAAYYNQPMLQQSGDYQQRAHQQQDDYQQSMYQQQRAYQDDTHQPTNNFHRGMYQHQGAHQQNLFQPQSDLHQRTIQQQGDSHIGTYQPRDYQQAMSQPQMNYQEPTHQSQGDYKDNTYKQHGYYPPPNSDQQNVDYQPQGDYQQSSFQQSDYQQGSHQQQNVNQQFQSPADVQQNEYQQGMHQAYPDYQNAMSQGQSDYQECPYQQPVYDSSVYSPTWVESRRRRSINLEKQAKSALKKSADTDKNAPVKSAAKSAQQEVDSPTRLKVKLTSKDTVFEHQEESEAPGLPTHESRESETTDGPTKISLFPGEKLMISDKLPSEEPLLGTQKKITGESTILLDNWQPDNKFANPGIAPKIDQSPCIKITKPEVDLQAVDDKHVGVQQLVAASTFQDNNQPAAAQLESHPAASTNQDSGTIAEQRDEDSPAFWQSEGQQTPHDSVSPDASSAQPGFLSNDTKPSSASLKAPIHLPPPLQDAVKSLDAPALANAVDAVPSTLHNVTLHSDVSIQDAVKPNPSESKDAVETAASSPVQNAEPPAVLLGTDDSLFFDNPLSALTAMDPPPPLSRRRLDLHKRVHPSMDEDSADLKRMARHHDTDTAAVDLAGEGGNTVSHFYHRHSPPSLPPALEDLIPKAGETESEKAEREQKAVQRMIQVVNVLGSLQNFLSDRAKTLVRRLSRIVEEEEGQKLE